MSLDVEERQILVRYEGDAIPWRHRVLLVQIDGAKWIWGTPDLEVQSSDLAGLTIRALARASPFPNDCAPVYAFDNPIDGRDLNALRAEAGRLAAVLGVSVGVAAKTVMDAEWLFADYAVDLFGTAVSETILGDQGKCIVKSSKGIAEVDGEWQFIEHVATADKEQWMREKRLGPGRDPRVAEPPDIEDEAQIVLLKDQVKRYKDITRTEWPFEGPKAVIGLLKGVASSGRELMVYPLHYIKNSGVNPKGALAIEMTIIFTVFHLLVTYDGLNPWNLASAEMLARRVLMAQRAIKRNPAAPDFDGLDLYIANSYDSSGGVITVEFDEFIAELQKADATIMKQSRQLREEQAADAKRKKEEDAKGGGGGGRKKD